MGEGGGRGLPAVRLSIWGLRGSVRGKGEGGGVWGCVGGPAHAYPLPGVAHRLVSGAGDIKLTKDGNVLLQEMVSREGGRWEPGPVLLPIAWVKGSVSVAASRVWFWGIWPRVWGG